MSSFAHEDRQGSIDLVSDRDIILEADRDQDGAGDLVFRTGGVERARINHAGVGSGWGNVLGGSNAAAYASPIAPRLRSKLALGLQNATIVVLDDSTGVDGLATQVTAQGTLTAWLNKVFPNSYVAPYTSLPAGWVSQPGWVYQVAQWLASQYPAYTVTYYTFTGSGFGGSWSGATTLQTGTGSATLAIYNGAVSGTQEQYALASTRLNSMVRALQPDLTFLAYGHNDSAEITRFGWRMKALAHSVLQVAPLSELCMVAQNPEGANTYQQQRVAEVARVARQTGAGFVNFCQAFIDADASWATDLLNNDQVHPNSAGVAVEVNAVAAGLYQAQYVQPAPPVASGFAKAGLNLLNQADFSDYRGASAILNGWTMTACTASQDSTNYENARGFAVKLTSDGSTTWAKIAQSIPANGLQGEYVTVAVRMYVPSAQTDDATIGSVSLGDNINGTNTSLVSINCRDGWHWALISGQIAATASTITVSVNVDSSNSHASNITVDRVVAVVGDEPRDIFGTVPRTVSRADIALIGRGILAESVPWSIAGVGAAVGGTGATSFPTLMAVGLRAGDVVTGAVCFVVTAGASVTSCKMGLYKKDGTFLRATADVHASLAANTPLQQPFTSQYVVPADDVYLLAFWSLQSGGTTPTITKGAAFTSMGTALANGVNFPASSSAALSDLSGNVTVASANTAFWLAAY